MADRGGGMSASCTAAPISETCIGCGVTSCDLVRYKTFFGLVRIRRRYKTKK